MARADAAMGPPRIGGGPGKGGAAKPSFSSSGAPRPLTGSRPWNGAAARAASGAPRGSVGAATVGAGASRGYGASYPSRSAPPSGARLRPTIPASRPAPKAMPSAPASGARRPAPPGRAPPRAAWQPAPRVGAIGGGKAIGAAGARAPWRAGAPADAEGDEEEAEEEGGLVEDAGMGEEEALSEDEGAVELSDDPDAGDEDDEEENKDDQEGEEDEWREDEEAYDPEDAVEEEDSVTVAAAAADESSLRRRGATPPPAFAGEDASKGKAPWKANKAKPAKKQEKRLLPIQEKADEVVPVLCGESPVCCLVGETGSGKSTQVPQMILEQARAEGRTDVRIAVTQPRRVAALNLARRVAWELGEWGPGETVGYRIGGESKRGWHIDFCTVGYLLQLFLNAPDEFGAYTHVVLDEVHERSAESDMLCLVVRLLTTSRFPDTRVVVMSATLQSDLFVDYFTRPDRPLPSKVYVGARCFPVTEYFLDELGTAFDRRLQCDGAIKKRIQEQFGDGGPKKDKGGKGKGKGKDAQSKRVDPRHSEKFHTIITELIEIIAEPGSTILIFLPGIAEISALWEEARQLEERMDLRVFPLHSMIPREEQEMVFQEPEPHMTNVVLATDIAESSITLPCVVAVIDLGLHRRVDHNQAAGISALATKWISKAAAKQRSGRAGRTQPGLCLRLYPKNFFEGLPDFEPPESASMPLDRLYLQAKQLAEKLSDSLQGPGVPNTAEGLLSQMVQAPSLSAIGTARSKNAELGVISAASESAKITSLGRLCLQLPIDLRLGRLVWLGSLMGVAADAVVLASVLSSMDPFSSPSPLFLREERVFIDKLRASTSARLLFDGGVLSEPLMHRQLFLEWMSQFHDKEWVYGDKERVFQARRRFTHDFSYRFSLHRGRMEHVISHVLDLSLRVFRQVGGASGAAKLLRGLIRGLGYVVNERGDLSGISWEAWREFRPDQVFESNTGYLKALVAMSFGDQLFVGGYGQPPQTLDLKPSEATSRRKAPTGAANIDRSKTLLSEMTRNGLKPRQTAVFTEAPQDLAGYIEFVCGERPHDDIVKIMDEEVVSLVPLNESDGSRWQPLQSRETAPLLDCVRRLPAEFNLLSGFEKAMRDLQRAKSMGGGNWSYGAVAVQHPCLLRWEWMQCLQAARGANSVPRCEGVFDRKNAIGCIGFLPKPAEAGSKLRRVASIAVASTVVGGGSPSTAFPTGVTVLAPGHLAFVLVSANIEVTRHGFRRFGFATNGSVTALHRTLELPAGCVDKIRWMHIGRLRAALRAELEVPEPKPPDGTPWRSLAPALLGNSEVADLARMLFEAVPTQDGGEEAFADPTFDPDPMEALRWTVDLDGTRTEGPDAFRPLANWDELKTRREELVKRGGRTLEGTRKRERDRRTDVAPASRREVGRADDARRRRDEDHLRRRREELPRGGRRDDGRRAINNGSTTQRREDAPRPSSMTLYELFRTVALRCCAAASDVERDRLMMALNAAVTHGGWASSDEFRKVQQRRTQAEERIRTFPRDAPREGGRTGMMECLQELETRLAAGIGREAPSRRSSADRLGSSSMAPGRDRDRGRSERDRGGDRDRRPLVDERRFDRGGSHRPGDRGATEHRSGRSRGADDRRDHRSSRREGDDRLHRRDSGALGRDSSAIGRRDDRRGDDRSRSRRRQVQKQSEPLPLEEQECEWVDGCYPWVRVKDQETGNWYFFNEETSESTWDHPGGQDA